MKLLGHALNPCWVVALCLLCVTRLARAGFERSCSSDHYLRKADGMCGNKLSMLLASVCRMYNKRSLPDYNVQDDTIGQKAVKKKDTHVFLTKKDALSVLKRDLSISGTITCECCVHRCGYSELTQYCSETNPEVIKRVPGNFNFGGDDWWYRKEQMDITRKKQIGKQLLNKKPWWQAMMDLRGNTADHLPTNPDDFNKESLPDFIEKP